MKRLTPAERLIVAADFSHYLEVGQVKIVQTVSIMIGDVGGSDCRF